MNKTIFNMGKMLVLGVLGMIGLASCTEEPDGSNLFSTDDKTIAELLRERPQLSAFYLIL
jgi:hypothetical protein